MSSITHLSAEQLRKAADIVEKIAVLESLLASVLESPASTTKVASSVAKSSLATPAPKKKRGMSAASKAKIAAAQKARWAKLNAAKGKVAKRTAKTEKILMGVIKVDTKPAKKRGMSAAVKAKMSEAKKAYWAKRKAAENKPF